MWDRHPDSATPLKNRATEDRVIDPPPLGGNQYKKERLKSANADASTVSHSLRLSHRVKVSYATPARGYKSRNVVGNYIVIE
jgi:hypothetical protein